MSLLHTVKEWWRGPSDTSPFFFPAKQHPRRSRRVPPRPAQQWSTHTTTKVRPRPALSEAEVLQIYSAVCEMHRRSLIDTRAKTHMIEILTDPAISNVTREMLDTQAFDPTLERLKAKGMSMIKTEDDACPECGENFDMTTDYLCPKCRARMDGHDEH